MQILYGAGGPSGACVCVAVPRRFSPPIHMPDGHRHCPGDARCGLRACVTQPRHSEAVALAPLHDPSGHPDTGHILSSGMKVVRNRVVNVCTATVIHFHATPVLPLLVGLEGDDGQSVSADSGAHGRRDLCQSADACHAPHVFPTARAIYLA
jgi:hypothetical protein